MEDALAVLGAGGVVRERQRIDLKEEAGRRGAGGVILPGSLENEAAARHLAAEVACMANTPGGGALLVGVADDSSLIGTELDAEWLRMRIYQLTQRLLTVTVTEVTVRGKRLLVLRSPQAIEPIRVEGKIRWRVADQCAEIDAAAWHQRRAQVAGYDWSAQPSGIDESAVRARAVEVAREFLTESGEPRAIELAEASTADLLRRLNAVTGDGELTNAAVIAFVGRNSAALDYIRRDYAGGDSLTRVRRGGRGALEELSDVYQAFMVHNPLRHVPEGLVHGQVRSIPERAGREAIVNAVAHRDWHTPDAVTVEHTGATLTVTSPGGFYGGVTAENIITHPSRSRNTALAELLASLRVAEREGIGVDRIYVDMLRLGNAVPDIAEIATPSVRVALSAEVVDPGWGAWLQLIEPARAREDLRWLLTLHELVSRGWVDVTGLAPLLQVRESQAADVVAAMWQATIDGTRLLEHVDGVPAGAPDAWLLSRRAGQRLRDLDVLGAFTRPWPEPTTIALGYARARGRISSTELASLTGRSATNVGTIFRRLEDEGRLEPSRPNRRGAGFFYRYVT